MELAVGRLGWCVRIGGMVFAGENGESGRDARPAAWRLAVAFAIVYLGYGLNFLAVKVGVETMPPFLFAGAHVVLAGVLLWAWKAVREEKRLMSPDAMARAALAAFFLFVGGVGLVTLGEKLGVASGKAAMIKASVPLWVAVLEALRPKGEKPAGIVVVGLLIGAAGVGVLVLPGLAHGAAGGSETRGIAALLASAALFALGTLIVRHHPPTEDSSWNAAWMMLWGGVFLLGCGAALGEAREVEAGDFTAPVLGAFLFLLFVHSLAAFSAMNWLLRHLPAPVVATKFHVSPAIATLAGFLVLGESVPGTAILGLVLILAGVGVVMAGERRQRSTPALRPDDADELEG